MRHFCISVIAIILSMNCMGQDSLSLNHNFYKEHSISIGYDYTIGDPNERNYHMLESRIQKQRYGGRHPGFTNLSAGLIVGINTDKFLISPVIGGQFGFSLFFLGLDATYFTDFEDGSFRLIPNIGFGYHQFRISINPHIRLGNRDYEPIDRGHFNLTIRLFTLKKEKL